MKTNRAKQLLNSGQVAIGTMIAECRSPEVARVIAAAGFDFFITDFGLLGEGARRLAQDLRAGIVQKK